MKVLLQATEHNSPGPLFAWADSHHRISIAWQHNLLARQWGVSLSTARVIASNNGLGPREVL